MSYAGLDRKVEELHQQADFFVYCLARLSWPVRTESWPSMKIESEQWTSMTWTCCLRVFWWLETAGGWITTAPVSLYHCIGKPMSNISSVNSRVHLNWKIKMIQNAYRTRKYLQPSVPGNWATSTFSRRLPEPQGWARLENFLKFSHAPESPRCVSVKMSRYCRFWEAYLRKFQVATFVS